MSNSEELIKKDLYEIYEYLYELLNVQDANKIFSSKLIKKFRYLPCEIADVLGVIDRQMKEDKSRDQVKIKPNNIRNNIANICDLNSLREFYYENLSGLFIANVNEDIARSILNSITIKELKYLYSLISPIPIKSGKSKKDIIYLFKNYFDDEARTNNMVQKLI